MTACPKTTRSADHNAANASRMSSWPTSLTMYFSRMVSNEPRPKCSSTSTRRSRRPFAEVLRWRIGAPFQAQKLTSGCTSRTRRENCPSVVIKVSTSLIFDVIPHACFDIFLLSIRCRIAQASFQDSASSIGRSGAGKTLLPLGRPRTFRASVSQALGPLSVNPMGISIPTTSGGGSIENNSDADVQHLLQRFVEPRSRAIHIQPALQPSAPAALIALRFRWLETVGVNLGHWNCQV